MATAFNPFGDYSQGSEATALSLFEITPDADNDLPTVVRWIYFGHHVSNAVDLVDTKGNVVRVNPPAGTTMGPFQVARVKPVSGTGPTGLVGYV